MFESETFWVAVALVIFLALCYKMGWKSAMAGLDARGDKIRKDIEDAQTLREEAQKALAEYKRKQRDAMAEAEEIIKHAKEEAQRLREQAQKDLEASLVRREQLAMEKIAQAEASAMAEVRDKAVDVAVAATEQLLRSNLDASQSGAIMDRAIGELSEKLH